MQKQWLLKCSLLGICCLAFLFVGIAMAEKQKAADKQLKPCVAISGTHSQIKTRQYHRITSTDAWDRVWKKHRGEESSLPQPEIDFDHFMVIAIFQGDGWNSRGLEVISISEKRKQIVFRYDDKSYQTFGSVDSGEQGEQDEQDGKVTVYGFFVLPRSEKPIVIEEDVQWALGEPPVWKKRIVLPKTEKEESGVQ